MAPVEAGDQPGDIVAGPVGVAAIVERAILGHRVTVRIGHRIDGLQNLDVVGDGKAVAAVLVAEQIIEIVETRPISKRKSWALSKIVEAGHTEIAVKGEELIADVEKQRRAAKADDTAEAEKVEAPKAKVTKKTEAAEVKE